MDDLIDEFLTETNESLDELDVDLVNLEQNPNDADLLGKIFRLMHTIKGTCGFLGLPRLEKVAHHAENVLGRFRDGDLEVTADYVTLIFDSLDRIKFIVGGIAETGQEPEGDDSELIAELDEVFEGKPAGEAATSDDAPPSTEESSSAVAGTMDLDAMDDVNRALEEEVRRIEADLAAQQAKHDAKEKGEEPAAAAPVEEPKAAPPPPTAEKKPEVAAAPKSAPPTQTQSLRVSVDVLEDLMTMVSELVLTRNQLLQILRQDSESEFSTPLQRLNHVVSDLQEGVMKTRMQPIGNAWSKLPRIIRDLSLELGKKIDLEMRGKETELDRQVLDLIKDPLTHMVRNSGDHGIESPEDRLAAGKPETGQIILNAYHEGGHINIEISDDGKGLSPDKIKKKILENELASEEELESMSTQQINQFIFKAGFSTAEKVTSVSGRGVGMDVVRTNIEKIGGSIELKSAEGKGSTFTIKIPLTLAIVSALIVEAAGERFAIPQLAVRELVMTSDHSENQIEDIKGTPVFRLRDRLLPLVSLRDLLRLSGVQPPLGSADADSEIAENTPILSVSEDGDVSEEDAAEDTQAVASESKDKLASSNQYIIVATVGTYDFGIIVDRVYDTEEIVVKPVSKILRDIDLFSGNTILGDGTVIMILDPNGIANSTGEVETQDSQEAAKASSLAHSSSKEKTSLLLFRIGEGAPKAVPLSLVARLENVCLSNIENSSGQMMVQYREQLMPLMTFDNAPLPEKGTDGSEDIPVLVFTDKERSLGLVVDEIIDITEEHVDVQISGANTGLFGSAIIDGKATDIVDVAHYLQQVNADWFKDHDDKPFQDTDSVTNSKKRVLLVDDSPFFRNMLTPILSVAGYEVTTLESPIEALEMCEKGADFDVIVSDIEMPDMNGFEFAEKVKSDSPWQNTPMVALTSHATPQDIDRGKSVGFNQYIAKFDRDTLLTTLSKTLSEDTNQAVGEN